MIHFINGQINSITKKKRHAIDPNGFDKFKIGFVEWAQWRQHTHKTCIGIWV